MLVSSNETLREAGQLPLGWPSLCLDGQAYGYSSFALSLLLVRNNTFRYQFRTSLFRETWPGHCRLWTRFPVISCLLCNATCRLSGRAPA